MRIVVVGGSGLIGDKVMTALHEAGHMAVAASPAFGIDAFKGEGWTRRWQEPTPSSTSPTPQPGKTRRS
jgi:aspartate-semialdehyde dehydrogenase